MVETRPLRVLVLGTGQLGKEAAVAASAVRKTFPGEHAVIVTMVNSSMTTEANRREVLGMLPSTDILVDATARQDRRVPIIPNGFLDLLPQRSVILDLAADPVGDGLTKALEGTPLGTLAQQIFRRGDPGFTGPVQNQRATYSCDGWSGLSPRFSMDTYGGQILPLFKALTRLGTTTEAMVTLLSPRHPDPNVQALARSTLQYYNQVTREQLGFAAMTAREGSLGLAT